MTMSQRTTALIYVRVSRLDSDDRKRVKKDGAKAQLRALSPTTRSSR